MVYFSALCDSLRDMRNLKILNLAGMSVCVHVSTMIIYYVCKYSYVRMHPFIYTRLYSYAGIIYAMQGLSMYY